MKKTLERVGKRLEELGAKEGETRKDPLRSPNEGEARRGNKV